MSEMKQVGSFKLLPPPPDHCQTCAVKHEPGEPHNQESFYYQFVFYQEHGRPATWHDAMAHCSDEMKELWIAKLKKYGVEVETAVSQEASHHE